MYNNKWQALSMKDRAFLIREAVRNGITDIGSIRDTWEHRFDGNSNQPTEDEYIAQRAKERIQQAQDKAYNRTETVIPVFGEKTEADRIRQAEELEKARGLYNMYKTFKQKIDRGELIGVDFGFGYLDKKQINKVLSEAEAKLMHATYMHDADKLIGPGCVATSMDNYGKNCISNQQFAENPKKYGFVKIDNKEIKPGDIVQFDRKHMLMSNTQSTNNQGELTDPLNMRYSGSNGYDAVRKGSRYPADWGDIEAYRFVGDKADSLQWKNEYREKYGHKFGGEDDTQQKTYISKKPKNNIKTGNVEFDLRDFDTWRYHNAPTYSEDTDFTLSFTDALLDGEKYFKWGDNYYSTEIDYNKKFTPKNGRKPFEEFADYMYPAVIQVLQENNMPVDMAHNIVRQAAMESNYGLSPRGERGFNLSGIKWTQKAGDAGYKYTTGEDGEKYINFKNLKEYINYKVHTLNNNYNALNASDVQDYVVALHPKAFGKKPRSKNYKGDYSAGAKNYKKSMTGMSSLDKTLMGELYFPLFKK